ncbi:MAG: hypothetical protein J6Q69_00610 [Clostridia bacterium]|nr:hypothetical protein [Clostridia bacterium]
MRVISKTSEIMHKDLLHNLKLRQSIFEKSYPILCGKDIREIDKLKIPYGEREEYKELLSNVYAHELFFSSLSDTPGINNTVRRTYGSEAAFLYELLNRCMKLDCGFLLIYRKGAGVGVYTGCDLVSIFMTYDVRLAVDLYEHAYLFDYGFDKKSYLKAALSSLDLSKIENVVEKRKK